MPRTNEGRYYWCNFIWNLTGKGACLVLDALSKAAPQIERVFLGICIPARELPYPERGQPNTEKPMLQTVGLTHLKTFGIRIENLYQLKGEEEEVDVLASLVKDCPSLESLQIFGAIYSHESRLNPKLKGWLEALERELAFNEESRLREIKLFYVDRDHYYRRLDDHDYLVVTGKIEAPDLDDIWYSHEAMGKHQRPIIYSQQPWLVLEKSGLVERYRSRGIQIVLERDEGYEMPIDRSKPRPRWRHHDLLPPIGDINSDEALWEVYRPDWMQEESDAGDSEE